MITLADLPDDPTPAQIRQLDRASLEAIPYDRRRWACAGKGCSNGTHVRDYGIGPWYWIDRGSVRSHQDPARYWNRIPPYFWMCGRHAKHYRRLIKTYTEEHVLRRLFDLEGDLARYVRPV